jgi:Arc/MetJ-type ribon-helix-helix transcriptional regulator
MKRRDRKERLTVTIDPDLVAAANEAVAAGRAGSLSGWVNLALAERAAKERRLRAMAAAVAAYEAEFGKISAAEMEAQRRADERNAVVVRGPRRARRRMAGSKPGAP